MRSGYLDVHQDRLVRTVELVPVGSDSERLLELSSYLQMTPLIKRYGRYGEIAITNWWQGGPAVKMQQVRNEQSGEELSNFQCRTSMSSVIAFRFRTRI